MTLTSLLSAYLLGGVTLLPLLLVAAIATAWFTLPQVQDESKAQTKELGAGENVDTKEKHAVQDESLLPDGAANATFAVLRSYNFQTALSALGTKTTATPGGGVEGNSDGTGQESMSVYQSMYRSVFDRSKTALSRNPLAEEDETPAGIQARARATASARNIFHIVLRHGHLMLYDSPAELEVRHVISMAHHSVGLSDGDGDDESMLDADLFIKRTAILLKPNASAAHGDVIQAASAQPKPFYLFSNNCSEKEDFYHALIAAQPESPPPQPLDPACSIKLQSSIHSNHLTPETRAFNALINRIFLALHRTPFLEDLVRDKIEKKISRVAKPAFISYVSVQSIDLGDAGPILSNPRLRDINISGDMVLTADVKYTGGVKVVISAIAKLDLGQRFKVRTVDLVLAGILQKLQGRMLVRVKPPPSNRIWFTFESMPEMDIKVEPIVSSRQITYNWILRTIENRIREVFAETMVKPNWDDVPFFDTLGQMHRGGIWQEKEPAAEDEQQPGRTDPTTDDMLSTKNDKTMSMPNLPNSPGEFAMSSGAQTPEATEQALTGEQQPTLKHRSVTSLPLQPSQMAAAKASTVPKTVRSPSFTSPPLSAPSVAIDGSNVDAVKGSEVPQPTKRWIGRSAPPLNKRDAVDAVREVKDRTTPKDDTGSLHSHRVANATATSESEDQNPAIVGTDLDDSDERRGSASSKSSARLHANASDTSLRLPRTPSRESIARTDTASSTKSSQPQQRGKALFAATAAATSAARQWSLNALANRNKGQPLFRSSNASNSGPQEPVGRGQPLPPIGQPLPGPKLATSLWGGSAFAGGSVKRKPVLPTRRPAVSDSASGTQEMDAGTSADDGARADVLQPEQESEEDEFGPWRENFGGEPQGNEEARTSTDTNLSTDPTNKATTTTTSAQGKIKASPPPLPARRKRAPDLPVRPHERNTARTGAPSSSRTNNSEEDELRSEHVTPLGSASDPATITDSYSAIPAHVENAGAEKRGTLELEESDGIHIINVPLENGETVSQAAGSKAGTRRPMNVTMEEVSDSEYTKGNITPKDDSGI